MPVNKVITGDNANNYILPKGYNRISIQGNFSLYNTTIDIERFKISRNLKTMFKMFQNCMSKNIEFVSDMRTDSILDMGNLFDGCSELTSLNIANWDVSNVI